MLTNFHLNLSAPQHCLRYLKERDAIKKQMKKIFYYRDLLERNLKKNELQDLLEANKQEVPTGIHLFNTYLTFFTSK